jgi:hypothetical protein
MGRKLTQCGIRHAKEGRVDLLYTSATEENAYLRELAPRALTFCSTRFCPPPDPHKSYKIFRDLPHSACSYSPLLRWYAIDISSEYHTREQLCAALGHEMYHRVSMRIEGAHRAPWINETLAGVAERWLLREEGLSDFADWLAEQRMLETPTFDVGLLMRTRKRGGFVTRYRNTQYSLLFAEHTERFAIDFERAIPPESIRTLIGAASLTEWVDDLPDDARSFMRRTLLQAR